MRRSRAGLWFGLLLAFVLGALFQWLGLFASLWGFRSDIIYLAQQHLFLVLVSGGLAILVGVPLGALVSRPFLRRWSETIMQVINLGSTIPSLAVLALAMTFLGIGTLPAVFGLFVASLLPIVRNTYTGLRAVPRPLLEAATGMGMRPGEILRRIELPNALYVIFAGIRTALAVNVGTAPVAFLIGGGGLGELIFTGIDLMDFGMLLAGAVPTALLAVLVDAAVGQAQYWLVPAGVNPLR